MAFTDFVSKSSFEDIENGYDAYSQYKKISKKIKEFEAKTSDLAGEFGKSIGGKIGEIKTEKEFKDQFKKQQKPYKVAQQEYEMLKGILSKDKRYAAEFEELDHTLETRLLGPSQMINNPGMFSNKDQTKTAYETSNIAYDNLRITNILRNSTAKSLFSKIKRRLKKFWKENVHKSKDEEEITTQEQKNLVEQLRKVTAKNWSYYTTGFLVKRPKGVNEVKGKLSALTIDFGDKTSSRRGIKNKRCCQSPIYCCDWSNSGVWVKWSVSAWLLQDIEAFDEVFAFAADGDVMTAFEHDKVVL